MFHLLPLLALITTSVAVRSDATCYFVNGNIATADVPCNTSAEITTCCNKNDICLSNGLCYLQSQGNHPVMSRGSCTDQNWGGACKAAEPCARWNQGTGYRVVNAIDDQYCCGNVVSIDNTSIECAVDRAFTVAIGTVMPGVAALANYTKSSTSSSPSSSGNSSSDSSGDTLADRNDRSTRLAIGLGLGIPLGLIAGSVLIWGAWERKQRTASKTELEALKASLAAAGPPSGMGYNYQHGHGYAPVPAAPPTELGQYSIPVSELDSAGAKGSTRR
ncbi:hypothetical protein BDV38DRAFT_292124 [Aspergillus pseudotamarii]|uniref:Mid2 domain-containing protein n=1 Tax=Aspergillus pseudotamarii TaxID=132259 RepID=A0A5N6SXP2_ASPPS|nr:uncharacterized protein BDV38DRAFT_292124 [Aspergillus pseudotamarii]KAE8138520.1 hypothetical protein BDV38DRAFT_292124 [Aspergillus pseudotamarii]